MKRRIFEGLLLLAALAIGLPASAYDFMKDYVCYNILSNEDKTVEVTYEDSVYNYSGYYDLPHLLVIPETVKVPKGVEGADHNADYKVVAIGDSAFQDCYVRKLTIPATVSKIGYRALHSDHFEEIKVSLTSSYLVAGPEGLYSKNMDTLYKCLTTSGNSAIPSNLKVIREYAFYSVYANGSDLDLELPETLEEIGEGAFMDTRVRSINLPAKLKEIPAYAFKNTQLESIAIPAAVKKIGDHAFEGSRLSEVVLPKGLEILGRNPFGNIPGLASVSIEDDNPLYVSENGIIFDKEKSRIIIYPSAKTSLELPATVTVFDDYAFQGTSMKELEIPEQITKIGVMTFGNARNLKKLKMNSVIREIPDSLCYECFRLRELELDDQTTEIGRYAFLGQHIGNIVIPDNVKVIKCNAFRRYDCSYSESDRCEIVILGKSLERIDGGWAFYNVVPTHGIHCLSTEPPVVNSLPFGSDNDYKYGTDNTGYFDWVSLCVPKESIEKYKTARVWDMFKHIINVSGVTGIEDNEVVDFPVYDLQGRRVNPDNLRPGIYIRNHKKFVVK